MSISRPPEAAPIVIALEGLDAAGTADAAELVGRWLERKGRHVRFHASEPSPTVRAAAANLRTRRALTPEVAALLGAADLTAKVRQVRGTVPPGGALLLDRYAWTAAARDAARGLDLAWVAGLYAGCPRPDLVVLVDAEPSVAAAAAFALRGADSAGAAADAFRRFLGRVAAGYDALATGTGGAGPGPWPVRVARVAAADGPEAVRIAVRDALGPVARTVVA